MSAKKGKTAAEEAPGEVIVCSLKSLDQDRAIAAAQTAITHNPANRPAVLALHGLVPGFVPEPLKIAVVTTRYWGAKGVKLTVGFLDNPEAALRKRILSHMNAWGTKANVTFTQTATDPQVRIARARDGHWSYLGTDIEHVDKAGPTMNLQEFTMQTRDSEFYRVVRHETGHTLGFPHEHMRRELVNRIDPAKAIAFYWHTQRWNEQQVRQQVLTPLEEATVQGTERADPNSIMCYQIPASITRDGQAIAGGTDIDVTDYAFAAKLYPKPKT